MAFDWDVSKPGDDDFVNQFPANERAARNAGRGSVNLEHDADSGHHKIPSGNDATRDATTTWVVGSLFLNTGSSPAVLQRVVSTGPVVWEDVGSATIIPSGTIMCFFQASAPTGWTQNVSQNDKVLRVVSGSGGGTGGSWTISGISVNNHTLTISQIPPHTHSYTAPSGSVGAGFDGAAVASTTGTSTGSAGGGAGHNHGLSIGSSWRPSYIDVIICSKD